MNPEVKLPTFVSTKADMKNDAMIFFKNAL